jgi:hypothetical protein
MGLNKFHDWYYQFKGILEGFGELEKRIGMFLMPVKFKGISVVYIIFAVLW